MNIAYTVYVIDLHNNDNRNQFIETGEYFFQYQDSTKSYLQDHMRDNASDWDVHVVSHSPRNLIRQCECMTLGKAQRKFWGKSNQGLVIYN
jgi:hypothetical protein